MDFITGFPSVSGGYDSIFVVVDKLTKVAHLFPVKKTFAASDVAKVFIKEVVWLHGFPRRIINETEIASLRPSFGRPYLIQWRQSLA